MNRDVVDAWVKKLDLAGIKVGLRGTWKLLEVCERSKRKGYGWRGGREARRALEGSKLQGNVEGLLLKQSMKCVKCCELPCVALARE